MYSAAVLLMMMASVTSVAISREKSRPAEEGPAADEEPATAAPTAAVAKVRVMQDRCASVYKAADPALSCAVGYLQSGGIEAFVPLPSAKST